MDNSEINFEYYSLLAPPEGYTLGKAIGTTYSVDLTTALTIPLAFHFRNGIDPELIKDPFALFLSLKGTASKIDIFCQLGGISSNVNDNKLYRFIENSINEISLENGKSFHPKTWILRFEKEGEPAIYKVLNLSRNLTNDRCWDMVIALEGEVNNPGTLVDSKTNQPLIEFVNYLYKEKNKPAPHEFLDDLGKVCFRPVNDNFYTSIDFLPIGIGRASNKFNFINKNIEDNPFEHIVTVSPFVTQTVLDNIARNSYNSTLISRLNTLELLDQNKLIAIDCYYINEKIVDGSSNLLDEETPQETKNRGGNLSTDIQHCIFDLHAKVYLLKQGREFQMLLGSANASYNAFNGNVEFMICISGERKNSAELFKRIYFTPSNDFLVKYTPDPTKQKVEDDSREKLLEKYHRELCINISKANCICIKHTENEYSIQIRSNLTTSINNGLDSYIRPLSVTQTYQKPLLPLIEFSNIQLKDLSRLFVLTIVDSASDLSKSSILKLNIENLPENIEEAVVRSLINNKSDLFRLLRLLLSDDIVEAMLDGPEDDELPKGKSKWNFIQDDEFAIFEKMMMASSRNPGKLKDVKTVIEYLENSNSSQIIEDLEIKKFMSFWNNFKNVIEK